MMLGRLSAACSRRAIFTSSRPLLNEVRCTGGLVGYDVDPDVEAKLTALYTETLAELESIPESSEYRINVAKITNFRLKTLKSTER